MREGETYMPGLHALALDRLKPYMSRQLCMGATGCAYRGSSTCLVCPYAEKIAMECDWRCWQCNERWHCLCGQDGQEDRVDAALHRQLGTCGQV